MGNKCCSCRRQQQKEKPDTSNPALQMIREAQRVYFNSHIESDLDESDEDDDKDDSTDGGLYGSESSLMTSERNSLENAMDNIVVETVNVLGSTMGPGSDDTSSVLENGNVNNNYQKDNTEHVTFLGSNVTPNTGEEENGSKSGGCKSKTTLVRRRKKAKYIRLSKRGNFYSIFNTEDKKARSVDPKMYQYPFENIVFEGGGNKGLAYCGAVRLLEELNIWPQITRLAGTSAGAMTAALLAIGYNSHDLEQFFSLNLNNIFLDHRFGYLSLLPNLLTSYGWNPGNRIYKWFGQKILEKTGDMDITFKQVNEKFQRELCIVVTNLNQMTSLYCHPKTTPDMPVRLAVRMSMSIPGLFQAVKHTLHGQTDIFVDGGVLCNYPVHCFDGWWLSMKPEDNFLEKLQPLEDIPRLLERTERFGTYNEKTLGMQLYSDNEQDLLKYQLENLRHGVQLQELPNTRLAREKIRKKKLQLKTDREHRRLVKAMNAFLRALNKHNIDRNDTIDREELEAALNDESLFPRKRRLILFGDVGSDVILDYLDRDHNGQVSYNELLSFMEETGINMQNRFLGYQRRNIKNFPSFMDTLQATLLTNVKRVYVEERDLKRTVGINTGHVGTSDFVLEPADIEFVLERGRRSLEAFLKYYVASHHLKKKPEFKRWNQDLRKGSKTSIISSSSTQSLDSSNYTTGLTLTVPIATPYVLSPLVMDSYPKDAKIDDPPIPSHILDSQHTKSNSLAKSVSIFDKIEVIKSNDRDSLNSDKYVKDQDEVSDEDESEEVENEQKNSEYISLLGDQSEHKNKMIIRKQSGSPTTKVDHNLLLASSGFRVDSTVFPKIIGLNSSATKHPFTPNGKAHIAENDVKQGSLRSEVTVHMPEEKVDSSTTPLLTAAESHGVIEHQTIPKSH